MFLQKINKLSCQFHLLTLHPHQAKLGNSWVSPNVGHLILKYLCPALRDVLQDGLKAYVLDLIVGQRRCQPWSLVEASTQLGENQGGIEGLIGQIMCVWDWFLTTVCLKQTGDCSS